MRAWPRAAMAARMREAASCAAALASVSWSGKTEMRTVRREYSMKPGQREQESAFLPWPSQPSWRYGPSKLA
jgi:hypothetical protein